VAGAASLFAEPIRTPRTFEAAVDEILAGIERGRLRPGDRIPLETELARQLGISKPTLRQALRVLERSGVLQVKAGKKGGIFVASELPPHAAVAGSIAVEADEVVGLLRGRRVVETAVAHAAAAAATAVDYAELERVLRLLERHRGDAEAAVRADAMFHAAIARATHNRLLIDTMRLVGRRLAPLRDMLSGGAGEIDAIISVHMRQLRAMRNREPGQLDSVLDEHFRMLEERFATAHGQEWSALFAGPAQRQPAHPFEPSWQKISSLPDGYRAHAFLERLAAAGS
jgi:GntR family transcriptional repressor for pyruvate dehydrogenase complex